MSSDSDSEVTDQLNRSLLEYLEVCSESDSIPFCCKVQLSTDVPAGRGLVLTQDVAPGELLLSLPPSSLFCTRELLSSSQLSSILLPTRESPSSGKSPYSDPNQNSKGKTEFHLHPTLPLTTSQALSLSLFCWKIRKQNDLKEPENKRPKLEPKHDREEFFKSLPTSFKTSPLYWTLLMSACTSKPSLSSELSGALLASLSNPIMQMVKEVEKRCMGDWENVKKVGIQNPELLEDVLPGSFLGTEGVEKWEVQLFFWSWMCVNSRCVYLPLSLTPHSDNFTLAPILDMANHTPTKFLESKVVWTDSGGLELSAPTLLSRTPSSSLYPNPSFGLNKGDEIFITYGSHSNSNLFCEYGFALPDDINIKATEEGSRRGYPGNGFNEVSVDEEVLELFGSQGLEGNRKEILLQDRNYWKDWTLHPSPNPAHPSNRLVVALRLLAIKNLPLEEETLAYESKNWGRSSKRMKSDHKASQVEVEKEEEEEEKVLEKWEQTLLGLEDKISEENEMEAREFLKVICQKVERRNEEGWRKLGKVQELLERFRMEIGNEEELKEWTESHRIVKQLLGEERGIVESVRESLQEEW